MAPSETEPRPETYALDRLIQATTSRAQAAGGANLLFLGHRHEAFPTAVVCDPLLEPVDKVVWMVIMLQAHDTGGRAAFPHYERIAELANIASTSTIARAVAILRLTRWLSLCAQVRAPGGQFQGNVYALHDAPLPLADALYLDEGYMAFVNQSQQHHHARVCRVAAAVLSALANSVAQGDDPLAPAPDIQQRAQQALNPPQCPAPAHSLSPALGGPGIGVSGPQEEPLPQSGAGGHNDQHQYSKAVNAVELLGSGCSSSTLITTTTTTEKPATITRPLPPTQDALIFPLRLTENQRTLALQYLSQVSDALHQPLLDELTGRLQAETQGAKPLYDELRFFFALCRAARAGTFVPNLGLKVAHARSRAHAPQREPSEPAGTPRTDAEREALRQTAAAQLALIQQTLGQRAPH
tara:strand:+ start:3986 stop:5218 length:1233 start_codon:yes stop_codon:yes gene_type:complete